MKKNITLCLISLLILPTISLASINTAQINSILNLLSNFGADKITINNVRDALTKTTPNITEDGPKRLLANGILCDKSLLLTQNLRAPQKNKPYIKNNFYDNYTKGIVKEAHILQKHLNRLGFSSGKVDGIIGPNTEKAIKTMQRFLGTKADGYIGLKTRKLLNNSCEKIGLENYEKKFIFKIQSGYEHNNKNGYTRDNFEKKYSSKDWEELKKDDIYFKYTTDDGNFNYNIDYEYFEMEVYNLESPMMNNWYWENEKKNYTAKSKIDFYRDSLETNIWNIQINFMSQKILSWNREIEVFYKKTDSQKWKKTTLQETATWSNIFRNKLSDIEDGLTYDFRFSIKNTSTVSKSFNKDFIIHEKTFYAEKIKPVDLRIKEIDIQITDDDGSPGLELDVDFRNFGLQSNTEVVSLLTIFDKNDKEIYTCEDNEIDVLSCYFPSIKNIENYKFKIEIDVYNLINEVNEKNNIFEFTGENYENYDLIEYWKD